MKYNLSYRVKKDGRLVMGRRLGQFTRRIELSTGETMSSSWASQNLEYLGRYEESGFVPYKKPKIERITTPNGFKIIKQSSL